MKEYNLLEAVKAKANELGYTLEKNKEIMHVSMVVTEQGFTCECEIDTDKIGNIASDSDKCNHEMSVSSSSKDRVVAYCVIKHNLELLEADLIKEGFKREFLHDSYVIFNKDTTREEAP